MFDLEKLSLAIRMKRGDLSLEKAAGEIGDISDTTLWRIERKEQYPDLDTYARLCNWLNLPLDYFQAENDCHAAAA